MRLGNGRQSSGNTFSKASRGLWLRLPFHQVAVHLIVDPNDTKQHVIMNLTRGNGMGATIDLTRLTHAELVAFRKAVLIATEIAEPLVVAADLEAQEAADNGDDSDDRVYRGLPTMVVRTSVLEPTEHNQSVLQRHSDVFLRVAGGVLPAGGSEQPGGGVAEVEPGGPEPIGEYDLSSEG
jgi:hypothetical protein